MQGAGRGLRHPQTTTPSMTMNRTDPATIPPPSPEAAGDEPLRVFDLIGVTALDTFTALGVEAAFATATAGVYAGEKLDRIRTIFRGKGGRHVP